MIRLMRGLFDCRLVNVSNPAFFKKLAEVAGKFLTKYQLKLSLFFAEKRRKQS